MGRPAGSAIKGQGIEPLTERKAWKALQSHYKAIREHDLRHLFADEPKRGERMTGSLRAMLAQRIIPELESKTEPTLSHDSSPKSLIRQYRKLKGHYEI